MVTKSEIRKRRFTYLLFFGLFILLAPLVILYTAGYGFDLKRMRLDETGVIFAASYPTRAKVTINGLHSSYSTPARFNGLLPNWYEMAISMPGYHSWKNTVRVIPNQTTFVGHVQLFLVQPVSETIAHGVGTFLGASPSHAYFAWRNGLNQVALFDAKQSFVSEYMIPAGLDKITWSLSGSKAILWANGDARVAVISGNERRMQLFALEPRHVSFLSNGMPSTKISSPLVAVLFDPEYEENIFAVFSKGVASINTVTGDALELAIRDAVALGADREFLYAISTPMAGTFHLTKHPRSSVEDAEVLDIWNGPVSQNPSIVFLTDQYVGIRYNERLILSKKTRSSVPASDESIIFGSVSSIEVSPDRLKYLLVGDQELGVAHINEDTFSRPSRETLVRLSSPIDAWAWHQNSHYIVFAAQGNLTAIDMYKAGRRQLTPLLSQEGIQGIWNSGDRKLWYLLVQEKGITSLRKLTLQ